MGPLTERQTQILEFIREFQREHNLPPSTREIQRHFKFASQTTVMDHLRALAAKDQLGQLHRQRWGLRARDVHPVGALALPVYGAIPAGLPAMQEQEPEETIRVDPAVFGLRRPRAHHYWALRVTGDSMIEDHIVDGDLVILERREPRAGDIIAALVDGTSTTLKRLVHVRGRPILRAANPRYPDVVPDRLEAQGVVVGVIRRQGRN